MNKNLIKRARERAKVPKIALMRTDDMVSFHPEGALYFTLRFPTKEIAEQFLAAIKCKKVRVIS